MSQYLIRNVIYNEDLPTHPAEVFFRIILFKLFNRIDTWKLLENELGHLTYADYSYKAYDRVLSQAMTRGQRIYSAAYIMPSVRKFSLTFKHQNHLKLLEYMMSSELPKRIADSESMEEAFESMRSSPGIGNFLAYQYVTDLNYSTIINFSEMDFVVAGPGALDGIQKCFLNPGKKDTAQIIRWVTERQDEEFNRLGIDFSDLWGRPLQLIDCQNLFCEVDKYARVVHPEFVGKSGRSRIKQKLKPILEPIDYWYPPKWGINELISRTSSNEENRSSTGVNLETRAMDMGKYQEKVAGTDQNPGVDESSLTIPLLGLASESGELLSEYKKYLRDGDTHKLFKDRLSEELGDLLWYVANVATKFNLDLKEIAELNLAKCDERWGTLPSRTPFDAGYPENEQFPRSFSLDFSTYHDEFNNPKIRVMYKGQQFGDDLTDNAYENDGYGLHDVIHLSFAAVLGWSPLVRKMFTAKRKSDPKVDEVEDGARAIVTEEALSAMIFAYARDYNFLEGKLSVSSELLRMIKNTVLHLEVSACTTGEWERAILQGFKVWRELKSRGGGTVDLDLDKRDIVVREIK